MKNLKFKPNLKNVFRYIYLAIIALNLIILFYLYNFLNEYAYQSFFIDPAYLIAQTSNLSDTIDKNKFEKINNNLEKKLKKNNLNNISDIFD